MFTDWFLSNKPARSSVVLGPYTPERDRRWVIIIIALVAIVPAGLLSNYTLEKVWPPKVTYVKVKGVGRLRVSCPADGSLCSVTLLPSVQQSTAP